MLEIVVLALDVQTLLVYGCIFQGLFVDISQTHFCQTTELIPLSLDIKFIRAQIGFQSSVQTQSVTVESILKLIIPDHLLLSPMGLLS
jgi:hypothetical protein